MDVVVIFLFLATSEVQNERAFEREEPFYCIEGIGSPQARTTLPLDTERKF